MSTTSRHRLAGALRNDHSVLKRPGWRGLFAAQFVSSVGSAAGLLAMVFASYHHAHSIVHTAIVASAYGLPAVALGPVAARLADTGRWRTVILGAQGATLVVWLGLAAVDIVDWLDPRWLTLSSLFAGSASALQYPSWQRFERATVADDQLDEANALLASAGSLARIIGAVAGGFVLAWTAPAVLFIADAASYVPMMFVVSRLSLAAPPTPAAADQRDRAGLGAALVYARRQPSVRDAVELVVILTLLAVPIVSLLPALAGEFGGGAHVLGLLTAVYSLGGTLVAAVMARVTALLGTTQLVTRSVITCGAALLLIAGVGSVHGPRAREVVVVALLVPIGLGLTLAQSVLASTVQLAVTPSLESAVLALYAAVVSLVAPVGALSLAAISDTRSVWLAIGISGTLLIAIGGLRARRLRRHAGADDPAVAGPAAVAHASHLARFAEGVAHPGRFQPVAVTRTATASEGHAEAEAASPGG